jgi:FkbM family methyltransferase
MRWLMKQAALAPELSLQFTSGFRYHIFSTDWLHADVLMAEADDQTLEIDARGTSLTLKFLVHAWCGAVWVEANDERRRFDLFADEHGLRELTIPAVNGAIHVVLRLGAPADERAKARQMWLAAVDLQTTEPSHRSLPITETCELTRGDIGTFITLMNDSVIGASIVKDGLWAPRDLKVFGDIVEPGMTVLDIGANIGHHTVFFSKRVGKQGRVVAFEPQRTIYHLLAANAAINGCRNVELFNSCVGVEASLVRLFDVDYDSPTNFGALGIVPADPSNNGEQVRIDTLDNLLSTIIRPLDRCDFIKIDVQSFELFVLRGAEETIRKFRPTMYIEISPYWMRVAGYDYKEIYQFLHARNYDVIHIYDAEVPPGAIKLWSGSQTEEWDVVARPRSPRAGTSTAASATDVDLAGMPRA